LQQKKKKVSNFFPLRFILFLFWSLFSPHLLKN
jgi:hypothetical protein